MAEQRKIFVFDFDGVVCDSTNECMVTSWNAWEKWNHREGFRRSIEHFSNDEMVQFRNLRPRVRGAGEYYILRRSLEEGKFIEDQATYDKIEEKWHEYLKPFKEVFFEMRERFRKEDLDGWIELHQTFDDVIKIMKRLHSEGCLYIATLKDEESVRLILERQGVVLPQDHLLDQSQIKSKLQALIRFLDQTGCAKDDLVFIDDNVTHLLEPKSEGFKVYLAAWNFPVKEYLDLAAQHQIQVLKECGLLFSGKASSI